MSHISISVRSLRIKSFPRNPPKCTAFFAFPSPSHHPPRLSTFDIIHPSRNRHILGHKFRLLQILDVLHDRLVEIGKRQEIGDLFAQFGDSALSASPTQSAHFISHPLLSTTRERKHKPKIILHNRHRILMLKRQHPAPRMLDQHNLVCRQQLLADDDGAERVGG